MPLTSLPNELLLQLYKHLPSLKAVYALSLTCKKLSSVFSANRSSILFVVARKEVFPWQSAQILAHLSTGQLEVKRFYRSEDGLLLTDPALPSPPSLSSSFIETILYNHRAFKNLVNLYTSALREKTIFKQPLLPTGSLSPTESDRIYAAIYLFRIYRSSPVEARRSLLDAHSMVQLLEALEVVEFLNQQMLWVVGDEIFGDAGGDGDVSATERAVTCYYADWDTCARERLNQYDRGFGLSFPHEVPVGWKILDAYREYVENVEKREVKKRRDGNGGRAPRMSAEERKKMVMKKM